MNNRHQLRESAMTCLYQYFLLNKDIKQIVFENSESHAIDPFLSTVTIDAVANKDFYIKRIRFFYKDFLLFFFGTANYYCHYSVK